MIGKMDYKTINKNFLERNNLPYKEIKVNNQNIGELRKLSYQQIQIWILLGIG